MLYITTANSTLYVKVNFKRKPYSNELTAVRLIAHTHPDFNNRTAMFVSDLHPDTTTLEQVYTAADKLCVQANIAKNYVTMPNTVAKKLSLRS